MKKNRKREMDFSNIEFECLETNLDDIVYNILTWQYGMFQEKFPKKIPNNITGFWSKRECNFFVPYMGKAYTYFATDGDIRFNYGSFQDGTSLFIKIIIDYYLSKSTPNEQLKQDCFKSICSFIKFLNMFPHENGGIPQYFPLQRYHFDAISLNDDGYLNYLKNAKYILESNLKLEIDLLKLQINFEKSLDLLLDLQIMVDGEKTIWAQQYNQFTLKPSEARTFEPAALCSYESSQLLLWFMTFENPSEKMKNAIITGCEWIEQNKIINYIQDYDKNNNLILDFNPNIEHEPLYARYYDLKTFEPFAMDRDSKRYGLHEINIMPLERRNGYTWFGKWGNYLLEEFSKWKNRHSKC